MQMNYFPLAVDTTHHERAPRMLGAASCIESSDSKIAIHRNNEIVGSHRWIAWALCECRFDGLANLLDTNLARSVCWKESARVFGKECKKRIAVGRVHRRYEALDLLSNLQFVLAGEPNAGMTGAALHHPTENENHDQGSIREPPSELPIGLSHSLIVPTATPRRQRAPVALLVPARQKAPNRLQNSLLFVKTDLQSEPRRAAGPNVRYVSLRRHV